MSRATHDARYILVDFLIIKNLQTSLIQWTFYRYLRKYMLGALSNGLVRWTAQIPLISDKIIFPPRRRARFRKWVVFATFSTNVVWRRTGHIFQTYNSLPSQKIPTFVVHIILPWPLKTQQTLQNHCVSQDSFELLPSLSPDHHCTMWLSLTKISRRELFSFAPIFLGSNYFRQNIWGLSPAQFHFWYIFED